MAPDYLKDFFFFSINYFLRQNENLTLPKPNTDKNCKCTFQYRGSKLYNNLPTNIRRSNSLAIFNKEVQKMTQI